jgi:hypothetical protein
VPKTDLANTGEIVPFFDESRVPVETIMVMNAEVQQFEPAEFDVIGQKVSYRLAQPSRTCVCTRCSFWAAQHRFVMVDALPYRHRAACSGTALKRRRLRHKRDGSSRRFPPRDETFP